ncbi:MAG: DNA polymerase III subunit gamma/tau [Nannocystaceae bacterium]
MAYVVLARKYRPQRFADLVGQEHVTRTLANAIAGDRVHHAYLFCGARGLGKTTAARLLAKCLVCVKGPTIDPCNECNECLGVIEGRSVDVIEIDGASNNKVEDVRGLREQVRYLPQSARRKIYIIDEVHMLTGSAFNALLKTLEEPPPHVTFIFATTEVHDLPATILSRVARFDFRRLSSATLVGHLQSILAREGVSIEEAGLYMIARAGDGSVRDSLTLLDKVIAFATDLSHVSAEEVRVVLGVPSQLAVASLADAILARDAAGTLKAFDEIVASGQDLQQLAVAFLQHLRNLVVVKLCASQEVLVDASPAEYERLKAASAAIELSVLGQLFDRFARVVDALPHTRVPRLILEMGLLDLVHAEPLLPLGDLIEHLEQISRGAPALASAPRSAGTPREISNARSAVDRPAPAPAAPSPQPTRGSQPPPREAARPAPTQARGRAPEPAKSEFWQMIQDSGVLTGASEEDPEPPEDPDPAWRRPEAPEGPKGEGNGRGGNGRGANGTHSGGAHSGAPYGAHSGAPHGTHSAAHSGAPPPSGPNGQSGDPGVGPPGDDTCATGACPGSPRPAPEAAIDWANLAAFDAWEALLGRIAEEELALHAAVADMGVRSIADGVIALVAPAGNFGRDQLLRPESRAQFQELAHLHLGAPFRVDVTDGEACLPDLPSLTLVREQRRKALQDQVNAEARAHPSLQALVQAFEAEIRAVKPLSP